MNFKGQYLTYKEYLDLKGTLEEVPFKLLEYDVRKRIDKRTSGRLKNVNEVPEEVKLCVFKMVGTEEKYQPLETQNKTIASENTDGYSISYRKLEKSDIDTKDKELEDIIREYLSDVCIDGIPALYIGVDDVSKF